MNLFKYFTKDLKYLINQIKKIGLSSKNKLLSIKNNLFKSDKGSSKLKNNSAIDIETPSLDSKTDIDDKKKQKAKIINYASNIILIFAIMLAIYPFWGEITFYTSKVVNPNKFSNENYQDLDIVIDTENNESNYEGDNSDKSGDRIIIPKVGIDSKLLAGKDDSDLKYGAWMKPNGAQPGSLGNTIVTGHRFSYLGGTGPFYHLRKTNKGDNIIIVRDGKQYKYQITESFKVTPTDVWVEDATPDEILTLYTCEGLRAEYRYVVRAKRV
jgi:LPXTG-site transpeptidase (sortase) family protein